MKRLTDEELAELARTWPWACEDQSIERSVLADLRRYKAALEKIEKEPCVYAGWSGSHWCEAYEGKWCLSCLADQALDDDEEKP